jgi:hypothetical protein
LLHFFIRRQVNFVLVDEGNPDGVASVTVTVDDASGRMWIDVFGRSAPT